MEDKITLDYGCITVFTFDNSSLIGIEATNGAHLNIEDAEKLIEFMTNKIEQQKAKNND
jgi:hypothetical protein